MPGFVRTKKDEARWSKAKKAVKRSRDKGEGEFSDRDWALVNHIYHSMQKANKLESILKKAKKNIKALLSKADGPRLAEEYDPYEDSDEESQYAPDPELFEETREEKAEKLRRKRAAQEAELAGEETPTDEEGELREVEEPEVFEQPEEPEEDYAGRRGRKKDVSTKAHLQDPSAEDLEEVRGYTQALLDHQKGVSRTEAKAHENPILYARGQAALASHGVHKDIGAALAAFKNSDDYKNSPSKARAEMEFRKKWNQDNPDYASNANKAHATAIGASAEAKVKHHHGVNAKLAHLASGAQTAGAMSREEAMQHVGGIKEDEDSGTSAGMQIDPAARALLANPQLAQEAREKLRQRGITDLSHVKDIEDIAQEPKMNAGEEQKLRSEFHSAAENPSHPNYKAVSDFKRVSEIYPDYKLVPEHHLETYSNVRRKYDDAFNRFAESKRSTKSKLTMPDYIKEHPAREAFGEMYARYEPIIRSAGKQIKRNYPGHDIDDSKLGELGYTGFLHAVNTWDPKKDSKFSTWVRNSVNKHMLGAVTGQYSDVPQIVQSAAKPRTAQAAAPETPRMQHIESIMSKPAAPAASAAPTVSAPAMPTKTTSIHEHKAMTPERLNNMMLVHAARTAAGKSGESK